MANTIRTRETRRQVRSFVAVWTFITLIMGMATFLAIYFTYNSPNAPRDNDNLSVALAQNSGRPVVIPSQTPEPVTPTVTSLPTLAPTGVPAVAQVVQPRDTLTPSATPTQIPPADFDEFEAGIQVQFSLDYNPDNQDGFYRSVKNDLGMNWVKTQIRWEDFEPEKDAYNWSVTDLTIASAMRNGLKTAVSIVTAPDWAREAGADLSKEGPPANNQDYVDFVVKVIQRYPGEIGAIEVWNEMNIDREWSSPQGLSSRNYTALLKATYEAVKAVDPGIIIITGALAPTGVDDGFTVVDDFRFTDLLIAAGALEYTDCYGAHMNGYNVPPNVRWDQGFNDPSAVYRGPFDNPHHSWSFRSTFEGYATRIRAANYDTKICVTEFGWAVTEDLEGYPPGFGFAQDNTLAEQAQWFPEAFDIMVESGVVRLAFVWNFNYAPQAGWNPDNDNVPYSLIGPGYTFRPAYGAIGKWSLAYKARTGQS